LGAGRVTEPTQAELDAVPLDWRYVQHTLYRLGLGVADGALDADLMADLGTMLLLNPDIHWDSAWQDEFDADWKERLLQGEAPTPAGRETRAQARSWAKAQLRHLDAIGKR
jgi:hypothetical protein